MLMEKEDLIQARRETQKLLCNTIRQFGISMVTLILCLMFANVLFPSIMGKLILLYTTLFGTTFGMMLGAIRAYNIFWEKTNFRNYPIIDEMEECSNASSETT